MRTLPNLLLAMILTTHIGCNNSATQAKLDSPDAAFSQFKSMGEKKNFEGLYEILTPEAQDQTVMKMVSVVAMLKKMNDLPGGDNSDNEKNESATKAVAHAKKFGLTDELLGNIKSISRNENPAAQEAVKSLTDPKGYCCGVMKILSEQKGNSMAAGIANATLTDVKINGDTATGMITMNGDTKERTFKKIDGSWRIDSIN